MARVRRAAAAEATEEEAEDLSHTALSREADQQVTQDGWSFPK